KTSCQSRRLEVVKDSKPISPRASAARQVEEIRAGPGGCLFPLTPALSLGERVDHSRRGKQSRPLCFPPRDARCSLSLRERVRVRGNWANYHLAFQTGRNCRSRPVLRPSRRSPEMIKIMASIESPRSLSSIPSFVAGGG